jgi:regulator of replication initiation timing
MFNLFPKKKSVDEILKDANLTPAWQWTPTQTPSMLQAQNDLIEQFLKENHDLKLENQKLKDELNKWEKDWDEQNKNVSELMKEVNGLRHLKQENVDLLELLAKYKDGYQGSCYACEPVGILNQNQEYEIIALKNELQYQLDQNKKLDLQIVALHKIIEGAKETIDNQKHPMYPLHWIGLDPLIHEQAKDLTIEESIDKVKQKTPWVEEPIDWNGGTEYDIINGLKVQRIPYVGCACGSCEDSKPKEKSWEEAASDLALRVVKLEKKVKELTLIKICQKQS